MVGWQSKPTTVSWATITSWVAKHATVICCGSEVIQLLFVGGGRAIQLLFAGGGDVSQLSLVGVAT